MNKFDRLNAETRSYNNSNVSTYRDSKNENRTSSYYFNYLNNQTYKNNNGMYPQKPY